MSKAVWIPTYMKPDWVCTINNKKYSYPAGWWGTVPDEVAELIENINAQEPVENPPETLEQEITRIAEEKVAEATAPAVVSLEYDDVEGSWRGDKTYEEIAALCEQGKQVVVEFDIPSYDGWVYRAPITLFGKGLYDGDEIFWFEVQIVDPITSYLMALVANGVADDRSWAMYIYQIEAE